MSGPEGAPLVKTLGKAFQVLSLFLHGTSSMTLADISRSLGWSKATAFRLCKGLEQMGFLQRDGDGRLSLGPLALDLGTAYLAANPTRSRAIQAAEALSRTTGATALIGSLVGREVRVVLTVEGNTPIKAAAHLGELLPIHATAAGKAIAASLADDELNALLSGYQFTPFTPRTISSVRRFGTEVQRVRKRGHSQTLDEYHPGVFSVAVSLDRRLFGRPSAVVAVLPAVLAPEDPTELVRALQEARASLDPFEDMRRSESGDVRNADG